MKIIKHGKIKEKPSVVFTCSNCDCVFEVDFTEYQTKLYYPTICFVATCPECKQQVVKSKG